MPRLANRAAAATAARELPAYQPPACPLNNAARAALGDLSNNRGTVPYEAQLKESVRHLGLGVGDLHERLAAQQQRLAALRQRREAKGATDKTREEERLEQHLQAFEADVDALTRRSEAALRGLVDMRSELDDEGVILGELYTAAATAPSAQQRRSSGAAVKPEDEGGDDDQDDADAAAVASTLDTLRELRAQKQAQYEKLSPYERYAQNNDYAGFKKLWHDAAAGEGGPPLPDASRWFRPDGQPVMDRPGRRAAVDDGEAGDGDGDDDGHDDDDDVAVESEKLSLKCPLTLRVMDEPYSNVKCKHAFEKSAILDYLLSADSVQCPQTGCSQVRGRRFGARGRADGSRGADVFARRL